MRVGESTNHEWFSIRLNYTVVLEIIEVGSATEHYGAATDPRIPLRQSAA